MVLYEGVHDKYNYSHRKDFFREGTKKMIDLKNFWRVVLENLPLIAAEGNGYTEAEFSSLLEVTGDDPHNEAALYIIQEIFVKTGILDANRLAEGKWRFVSYPARLFACSLISLMANDENIFPRDFWASDGQGQYAVLHAFEAHRHDTAENFPIRRTYVAWGLIKRCGGFVLKRRENREDDPDNAAHGGHVFPGGRLNMRDLDACGADMLERDKLAILYGVPQQLTESEERVLSVALERTLIRELNEELGLLHKIHYEFSISPVQSPPRTFVHGANGHHCITESRITFYEVYLTPTGDAFLASKCRDDEFFALEEIINPQPGGRKVFYDLSEESFVDYLNNLPDSTVNFHPKLSGQPYPRAKGKNMDAIAMILPIEPGQPLLLGDMEIAIGNQRYVDLLLLLGLNARFGLELKLLSEAIKNMRWGWLELDSSLCRVAYSLELDVKRTHNLSLVVLQGSMCRLNFDKGEIFFHPDLFSAELRRDELIIARRPMFKKNLFQLDAKSCSASLTQSNMEHLQNLRRDNSHMVTYDNLRKLRTRDSQMLDDLTRHFGLYRLYEPIDDSASNERKEFRFSIQVK
jgi:8-oxo-dGTP pyrophosphatase MutT (NUDIX family)